MYRRLALLLICGLFFACGPDDTDNEAATVPPTDITDNYRLWCPDADLEFESATTTTSFRVGEINCGGSIVVTSGKMSVHSLDFRIINESYSDMITLTTGNERVDCTICDLNYAGEMTVTSDDGETVAFAGWAAAEVTYNGKHGAVEPSFDITLKLEPFKPTKLVVQGHSVPM